MEQHAIPQAITTYKFRLVGDMTLKQFLELGFGLVMAWIIYNSGMNFLFKWTLAPFFAFFGFALAFVPIEDRPLDLWLINLFKALYHPTQFIYKTQIKPMDIFSANQPLPINHNIKINQSGDLDEYLKTLPDSPATTFDLAEKKYLEHITNLFGALGLNTAFPAIVVNQPQPLNPIKATVKGVRVRKLMTPQMCLLPHATIFQAPAESKQAVMPLAKITNSQLPISNKTIAPAKPISPTTSKPSPILPPQPKTDRPMAETPKKEETTAPVFAGNLVLPHVPDKPNLISGITLDKDGKILSDVILEIQDKQNLPVRALKSNKLGQFFISTPLADGIYQIQSEHESYKFAIIKLEAKGEIIPPLKIQAI